MNDLGNNRSRRKARGWAKARRRARDRAWRFHERRERLRRARADMQRAARRPKTWDEFWDELDKLPELPDEFVEAVRKNH